uniref:Uncharacterized protein n=1 Tax=Panagrolaimus sp. ES5 TaxID=591445 RepID=A0AC34G4F9_9BILA
MSSSASSSLLTEYINQLYANKNIIAMIMFILGVAIVLYAIKKINEFFEPPKKKEGEEGEEVEEDEVPLGDIEVPTALWNQDELRIFQRRDLIDHYAFYFHFKLFQPIAVYRYQDTFTFNIRNDSQIQQCFLDMFKRQADSSPDGRILFEVADIKHFRSFIAILTNELRDAAEARLNFGYYGYAPFAGMFIERTLILPEIFDDTKRSLQCSITLLCTDLTEPFHLDYKYKRRRNVAEEEETPANLEDEENLEVEDNMELEEEVVSLEVEVLEEEEEDEEEEEETATSELEVITEEAAVM